jgi:hypothetical protein
VRSVPRHVGGGTLRAWTDLIALLVTAVAPGPSDAQYETREGCPVAG